MKWPWSKKQTRAWGLEPPSLGYGWKERLDRQIDNLYTRVGTLEKSQLPVVTVAELANAVIKHYEGDTRSILYQKALEDKVLSIHKSAWDNAERRLGDLYSKLLLQTELNMKEYVTVRDEFRTIADGMAKLYGKHTFEEMIKDTEKK